MANEIDDIVIRQADAGDAPFLWEMLTYAASMTPGGAASVPEAQRDPYLRTYVDGWMVAGDLGVIATGPGGGLVGAAWVRMGLIVAEPDAPELAAAVVPAYRGRGVGAAMMRGLVERAQGQYRALLLSVREENQARHFYEKRQFEVVRDVTNRVGGRSVVMRLKLKP